MNVNKVISRIKGVFRKTSPDKDSRCKIQQSTFITALVCSFPSQESRTKSLGGLRRAVGEFTNILLSRGSFWERMASKRLSKDLFKLLNSLIDEVRVGLGVGADIVEAIGVSKIVALDSSSFSLNEGASEEYPAPRKNVIPAAMKIHLLYDLFGGIGEWFQMTPATTHDRKGFPPLDILKGALIIFDLAYWDYQLLKDMLESGVKFLSRVKSNSKIRVVDVITGASPTCIGFDLHSGRLDKFRGNIMEIIGEFIIPSDKESFQTRIIGFWNPNDHSYHWYATNLEIASDVIYSLYRLRWQLELVWKSWKSIFRLDEITSANSTVILNLALIGMSAGLLAGTISVAVMNESPTEKQAAFSVQRASGFLLRIARELHNHIVAAIRSGKEKLMNKIRLFQKELFDPNYKRRPTSIGQVHFWICQQD